MYHYNFIVRKDNKIFPKFIGIQFQELYEKVPYVVVSAIEPKIIISVAINDKSLFDEYKSGLMFIDDSSSKQNHYYYYALEDTQTWIDLVQEKFNANLIGVEKHTHNNCQCLDKDLWYQNSLPEWIEYWRSLIEYNNSDSGTESDFSRDEDY